MTNRISNRELQTRVDWINIALKRNHQRYAIGNIFIDHYSPGDNPYQYKLTEVMNEAGGLHDWTNYRMTRKEFYAYLNGIIEGIDKFQTSVQDAVNSYKLP